MGKIILIFIGLFFGYALQILARLKDKNEPGGASYQDFIPYIKKYDIETIFDVMAMISVALIWLNVDAISINVHWAWSPIIGFASPELWKRLVNLLLQRTGKRK